MKKILIIFFLLLQNFLFSEEIQNYQMEFVKKIDVGRGENQLACYNDEEFPLSGNGPTAFTWNEDKLIVLDTFNSRLVFFNKEIDVINNSLLLKNDQYFRFSKNILSHKDSYFSITSYAYIYI